MCYVYVRCFGRVVALPARWCSPSEIFSGKTHLTTFFCHVLLLLGQDEYHRGALKIDDKFGGSATDQYEAMFKVGGVFQRKYLCCVFVLFFSSCTLVVDYGYFLLLMGFCRPSVRPSQRDFIRSCPVCAMFSSRIVFDTIMRCHSLQSVVGIGKLVLSRVPPGGESGAYPTCVSCRAWVHALRSVSSQGILAFFREERDLHEPPTPPRNSTRSTCCRHPLGCVSMIWSRQTFPRPMLMYAESVTVCPPSLALVKLSTLVGIAATVQRSTVPYSPLF